MITEKQRKQRKNKGNKEKQRKTKTFFALKITHRKLIQKRVYSHFYYLLYKTTNTHILNSNMSHAKISKACNKLLEDVYLAHANDLGMSKEDFIKKFTLAKSKKPKRLLNSYMRFSRDHRQAVKDDIDEKDGRKRNIEVMKQLGALWRVAGPEVKEKYQKEFQDEKNAQQHNKEDNEISKKEIQQENKSKIISNNKDPEPSSTDKDSEDDSDDDSEDDSDDDSQ